MNTKNAPIKAPIGTKIVCKGWHQEAALRMLMNNLDPDVAAWGQSEYLVDTPLVIYADRGATYWIGGDANLDPDE